MELTLYVSASIIILFSLVIFLVEKRNPISKVYRVPNKKPKPNENDIYNVVKVDIDGVLVDLILTDYEILRASDRAQNNLEDIK